MRRLCGLFPFALMVSLATLATQVSADAVEVSLTPEHTALASESGTLGRERLRLAIPARHAERLTI